MTVELYEVFDRDDDTKGGMLPEAEAYPLLRKWLAWYGWSLQRIGGKYSLQIARGGEVLVGGSLRDIFDWLEDDDAAAAPEVAQ